MPDDKYEKLFQMFQGLNGMVTVLVGRLVANNVVTTHEIKADMDNWLTQMDGAQPGERRIFTNYSHLLSALEQKPDQPPSRPDWFQGTIQGTLDKDQESDDEPDYS